jgi:hypothetical protein
MPCQSHCPWLDHSKQPCHLSLFCLNILLSTLFWNTINLCSSLNVRDQVLHPYRITGKIIISYVLILHFSTADENTKGSGLNANKHYPSSIISLFPPESNFDFLRLFPNIWIMPYFLYTHIHIFTLNTRTAHRNILSFNNLMIKISMNLM